MSATGIYGLSGSGIDVDSMVKVGMMTKQNEYDRMYKKEVRQEWTKEAYANLYSDLTTFTTSTMSKYKMSSTLNPQTVSSTKSEVATATANADAAAMTHYVKVNSMSSNAYLLTGNDGITRADPEKEGSLYLRDLIDTSKLGDDGISFKVSDGKEEKTVTITYDQIMKNGQTLNDLVSAFNGTGLNIKATYDANNDAFSLYNSSGGSANGIYMKANDDAAAELLNNLNLHTVNVAADGSSSLGEDALDFTNYYTTTSSATIADASVAKSTDVDTGAATYSGLTIGDSAASLTVASDGTATVTIGENAYAAEVTENEDGSKSFNFSTSSTADNVTTATAYTLKLSGSDVEGYTLGGSAETTVTDSSKMVGMAGKDASVTIDGKNYTSDSNKLTVSNVTYTFMGVGTSTMTVSQDTEKVVENVKAFVDDYNALLDKLNDMYNEQKYADYDVLTESQKKAMTEEQIEKWEEKAKSGLMYRNEYVGKLISDLREAIYTPVESVDGKYKTMMSIGIESKTDRGHLKIDEDKLRKVLAEDPDIVYQMLGNLDSDDEFGKNGVAQRVSDVANKSMKSIKSYAGTSTEVADGSNLGKLIQDLQTKMSNFKVMMNAFESALYKKYDKMESAIQKLGMQLGYITGGQ
ncbi:flagellar filament capping protein FliD [Selenomonas sp. KH1T6]|uniref:flagellar filament capping protein FliD n=1 Tax=Selenomonas sp. KH1T6 TaxID=3158784 RepID=UPI0008A7EB77|nr:flagellar hook-associated protein 2 [Selenomonas ruminantium]